MTQAGGPAAINGFLYQILHHIEWIASVRLEGADQKNPLLVLEPRNGGDAQSEAPDQYLVEQYKTRANGTWALTDVEIILRDLRKAVPPSLPDNALYRFVTDGRDGRLSVFKAFLGALKSVEGPDYLNNDEKKKFRSGLTVTDREFFDHIVKVTRNGDLQLHAEERTVVFHLLSHFEMEFRVTSSGLIEKIERGLRPYVANLGDECGVGDRLVGLLTKKLSKGELQLDSTDLGGLLRGPQRLDSFSCEFAGYGRVGSLGLGRIHRGFYILGYYGVVVGCTPADSPRRRPEFRRLKRRFLA